MFAVWSLAACSDGGDETPAAQPEEILATCEDGYAARVRADESICGCEVEAGTYPDRAACLLEIGVPYASACYCDVVAADPGNADTAGCVTAATLTLADCLEPLACAEASAREACRFDYLQALGRCAPLERASLAAVELECLGEPATACPSGEQIPAAWVCDGQPDCRDMSDESDCEFTCGSGESIPIGFQCDAEPDCLDGSDEDGCEFACADGEAVPLPDRCDGEPDCKDMSDETDCPAP